MGLPAMLGQLTTLIYNIADTYFVSLTKEPAMIAAVTLCTSVLLIWKYVRRGGSMCKLDFFLFVLWRNL